MIQFDPASLNPSADRADPFVATGTALLIAGLASAGGSAAVGAYGAHKASQSADRSTQAQVDAANEAARIQAKSAADALAYTKQQDARARADAETTRRANYDQWAAREGRLGDLDALVGQSRRTIPGYVPLSPGDPTTPTTLGSAPTSGGGLPPVPTDLTTAITAANTLAYGGANKHSDPSYWAAMWAKDPAYTWRRLLGEGAGAGDAPTAGPFAGKTAAVAPRPTTPIPTTAPYVSTLGAALPRTPLVSAPPLVTNLDDVWGRA